MKNFLRQSVLFVLLMLAFSIPPAHSQFYFFENPLVGEESPDFTLSTLLGKRLTFSQYRGKHPAILFFWATWCPHCREALKEINKDPSQFEKQGVKLVLIDMGEEKNIVKRYTDKNNIQMDVWLDEASELAEPYALVGMPTFVFVNQDGIVKEVLHELPDDYLDIVK
ncbi:MAG: TlpA family protein disulfide reductase [Candidatus Omnitrophica bacterium]|nr:TlpA family protein disulfide reductase [Candidatus Omnitrophota bacterium]